MNTTEQIATSDRQPQRGVLATLCGLRHVRGIVASKTGPRSVFLAFTATLAALAFTAVPALAAAPTVLSESVSGVKATEARLEALVNPNSEVTECHFQYGVASVAEHEVQCETPLIEGGEQGVGVTVPRLSEKTVYHFRVVLKNLAAEEARGAEEHFETAIHPETPEKLKAQPVGSSTATLLGTLNPKAAGNPGSYEFFYKRSATECTGEGSAGEKSTGATPEPVEAKVTGLLPNSTYTFCLLARNEGGEESALSAPVSFTTQVAPPSISEASITNVASESATLHATVNPGGLETTYAFQYAPAGSTEFKPVLEPKGHGTGTLPEGTSGVPLEVHLQEGLSASTTYEFRLVATHTGKEEATSEPVWFRTQNPSGSFAMLDARAWEMVSPADKHGAAISPNFISTGEMTQAAAAGGAFTYLADAPTEAQPAGYTVTLQVMSKRGPQGWESQDIATPHATPPGASVPSGYVAFDEGLSSSILQPEGAFEPALSPQATEQTPFMRDNETGGYTPLVTRANDTAQTFAPFGEEGECPPNGRCGPLFVGAAPDVKHPVVQSHVALTETPLPAEQPVGLYEWSEGKLSLVSALPDGQAASNNPDLGGGFYNGDLARNAISQDGSRVVWSEKEGEHHLFMRYNVTQPQSPIEGGRCVVPSDACTIRLESPRSGSPEVPGEPIFQAASVDGSRVFFTDDQSLKADSGAAPTEESHFAQDDLYVCEVVAGAGGEQACNLTDLTPKHNGESASVQNIMPGISGEGCDVGASGECNAYFVANGVLTEEANSAGEHAVHGNCEAQLAPLGALCNLYVAHWDGSGWATRLVAVLSAEDFPDWSGAGSEYALQGVTSRVSPNGRYLEFMSNRGLTGYDSIDAATGKPDEEVYEYDARSGRMSCASCNPTGGSRRESNSARCTSMLTAPRNYGPRTRGLAAGVPGWTTFTGQGRTDYQSRYLTNTGRLFFNSNDALVSADVNGKGDVYEYEPEGTGNCSPTSNGPSIAFRPAALKDENEGQAVKGEEPAGCVGLISSGTASEEAAFLDASGIGPGGEEGEEVFFLTTEKLSPQDHDTSYDVYDAHKCTTISPCIAPPG